MNNWLQARRSRAALLAVAAFALVAGVSFLNLGQNLENLALDLGYRLRPAAAPPPELLIVGIDEASFQEFKKSWPWPRRLHAALINRLAAAGARVIAMDILFAHPGNPEDDQALAAAMRQAGNVIIAQVLETQNGLWFSQQILAGPAEEFRREAAGVALFTVTPDKDGVVRRFRLRLGSQETMPGLVIQAVHPQCPIPPDLDGLIHYTGPPGSIETVSYYQILDPQHPFPAYRIRHRIVLVGRLVGSSIDPYAKSDAFATPFYAQNQQPMSGVEVQAQVIASLLRGNWGREVPWPARLAVSLALLLGFAFWLVRLTPLQGLALLGGALSLVAGLSLALFLGQNLWFPPVLLGGGLAVIYGGQVFLQYLLESQEKRWLRHAFSRYVSPGVVDAILQNPEQLELGGEVAEVTVLFTDLAGFTTVSEDLEPQELMQLLNEYLSAMTQIILAGRGTLDKYIGDSLMAFWGAPLPLAEHAGMACRAALEMQANMQQLQQTWGSRNLPPLPARVGIHSGPVVAGNVGSRERFSYTVLGDTVNLAHRIEQANRYYGTEIMLSESTRQLLGEAFLVREVDEVQVKGRVKPVRIFELLGALPALGLPEWLNFFDAGRAAYLEKQWVLAARNFQEVLSFRPDDAPTKLYLSRCLRFMQKPPPKDWSRIHILENS
jgi:adenylate cyclase